MRSATRTEAEARRPSSIDALDLLPGERPEAPRWESRALFGAHRGVRREALRDGVPSEGPSCEGRPAFYVVPDAHQKELDLSKHPDEVGDLPCGDRGDAPDGIQSFEAHPASPARRVLFVRVGQDESLFDEQGLRLIGPGVPGRR
ncbi:MAG: hypothetical protein ABI682_16970 [Acidobacteriota bacterium]